MPDEEREEVSSSARVSTTRTFETAGAYTAQCRAKDGSGAAGDWSNVISVVVSELPGAETSPFGVFGPFEYQLDDPTVATNEQVLGYLADIGVPWVQEMYFTTAVPLIPQTIAIYSRVGGEGGMMPLPCPALDDPAWIQYEQDYAAALRSKIIQWKDRIRYFEVATEPSGFPPPTGWKNCEHNYADHLKTTYTTVKQECPGCKVVYGGLSGVYIDFDETFYSAQFLEKTLAAGAASYFDVFEFKQHAHRAADYTELRNKYQVYAAIFARYGLELDQIPVFVERRRSVSVLGGFCVRGPIRSFVPKRGGTGGGPRQDLRLRPGLGHRPHFLESDDRAIRFFRRLDKCLQHVRPDPQPAE